MATAAGLRRLWAPWRMEYISKGGGGKCIFCAVVEARDDRENLVIFRGKRAFVMMNRYPYNNGHLMVVPKAHVPSLDGLSAGDYAETCGLLKEAVRVIRAALSPHGLNMGMNIGECAGAGFKDHIHFHLVPRWRGDTNFMPVLADCKIVSEHLIETYDRFRPWFDELHSKGKK